MKRDVNMKRFKIGIQLYSLRDQMKEDFEGTLKKVSEIGYDCVEFAGYYDYSAEELKQILDKYGLTAPTVHQRHDEFLENCQGKMDFLKTLGVKYIAFPGVWIENFKTHEEYPQIVKDINYVCDMAKKNGFEVLYHNHSHEFSTFEDKYNLEWLIEDTGVMPELDVCWARFAGLNPAEYMLKYKDHMPVVHMKDFTYNEDKSYPVMRPLGDGEVDITSVLKSAEEIGSEYLIVEQDNFTDIDAFDAIEKSFKYLKELGA